MPRGMGHRPEMVKISPACVGHNKNLSPLENILLLLFVEKVQRGARTSRLASKGFGEKKEIKVWLYVSHFYDMCNQCQTIWIQIRPNILSCLIWVQTVWRADYASTCLRL